MVVVVWIVYMIKFQLNLPKAIVRSRFTVIQNILALFFVVYTGVSTRVIEVRIYRLPYFVLLTPISVVQLSRS